MSKPPKSDPPQIIVLEFNELCPPLLEKWMEAGLLPNFKRFHDGSDVFTTSPDVDTPNLLEPWIQWYSVHTGLPYDQHKVFNLSDGPEAGHPDIWRVLQEAGYRVGNISSMNAASFEREGSFYMADPWCSDQKAFPRPLQPIQDFIQARVQNYSRPGEGGLSGLTDSARLVASLLSSGLSTGTMAMAARQLWQERRVAHSGWKRAVLLDWLLFDVFRKKHREYNPQFATFFLNSTAHFQHAYWRFMDPGAFSVAPPEEEIARYGGAILFGYRNMDRLIGRFLEFERQGVKLIFMTALSQQPFLKREASGGQNFYRPHDMKRLLERLHIPATSIQPVMAHQFMVEFPSAEERNRAAEVLQSFTFANSPVFDLGHSDEQSLFMGCGIFDAVPSDSRVLLPLNGERERTEVPFFELFYRIEEVKSGSHHPDGALWLKFGKHRRHAGRVSILDLFPTLLDLYGAERPASGIAGTSLLPRIAPPQPVMAG